MTKAIACAAGIAALLAAAPAQARPRHYAVVVGSNPGGPGQRDLRFAEADARNVAAMLRDVGGYRAGDVRLLLEPRPAELLRALGEVALSVAEDAAAGHQSLLFFYYSGHARARALNLGREELPLTRLRATLLGVPATLKVVVLDACQSGAFSRIKGAEAAADFSFNSVNRLRAAGMAVMASSSGTELSQESAQLGSSYFTHHLLVGLRGAGDQNADGRVSLDEAYRYAYDRTLSSTARTAVGRQHVTLETDLKGKGEVPLSFPARADARLRLPPALEAEVLVERRDGGAVVAEVVKARGDDMRLALPPGRYRAIVRLGDRARQCDIDLRRGAVTPLAPGQCRRIDLSKEPTKGAGPPPLRERWALELGAGFGAVRSDRFTERLEDFGYQDETFFHGHYDFSVIYALSPRLAAVLDLSSLGSARYRRSGDTEDQVFTWATHGLSGALRYTLPLRGGALAPFAEAGAGAALGRTSLSRASMQPDEERHVGYELRATAGAQLMPWRRFGFFGRLSYVYAPVIDNLLGDVHDSGGAFFSLGARAAF